MPVRFQKSGNWKDKIIGACPCFIGGDNKLQVNSPEKECEWCELNDLKKLLFSTRKPNGTKFAVILMMLNRFYRKEILSAIQEMLPHLEHESIYGAAQRQLERKGFVYFITDGGIVKAYNKDSV